MEGCWMDEQTGELSHARSKFVGAVSARSKVKKGIKKLTGLCLSYSGAELGQKSL